MSEPVLGYEQGLLMLEELLEGEGLSKDAETLVSCAMTCFESIQYYENADEFSKKGYMVSVEGSLKLTLTAFESYMLKTGASDVP
jgi:hypothetical protein